MEHPWAFYPDLLEHRHDRGAHLLQLLGEAKVPAQTLRRGDVSTGRDWYAPDTRTALGAFEDLMSPRLWRRVFSPRARAHCPTLETVARGCEQELDDGLDLLVLSVIAHDGFADLARTPEHRIARALAGARANQVPPPSRRRGNRTRAPETPLKDLALGLRLLGVQACLVQGHPEWCPCLQRIISTQALPEAGRIRELTNRFSPAYGLGSTA